LIKTFKLSTVKFINYEYFNFHMDKDYSKIGKSMQGKVCEECKKKVREAMENVKKRDLLRPRKLSKKFANLLCDECRRKMEKRLRGGR